MSFLNVDYYELNLVMILLVKLMETNSPLDKRRSSVAPEDQTNWLTTSEIRYPAEVLAVHV